MLTPWIVSPTKKCIAASCLISRMNHYYDVIVGPMASQITSLTIVYSTVYSGADQRKRQSSASLAFERGIHRWPVNYPHKWPVTRKMYQFDDVIMEYSTYNLNATSRNRHKPTSQSQSLPFDLIWQRKKSAPAIMKSIAQNIVCFTHENHFNKRISIYLSSGFL